MTKYTKINQRINKAHTCFWKTPDGEQKSGARKNANIPNVFFNIINIGLFIVFIVFIDHRSRQFETNHHTINYECNINPEIITIHKPTQQRSYISLLIVNSFPLI